MTATARLPCRSAQPGRLAHNMMRRCSAFVAACATLLLLAMPSSSHHRPAQTDPTPAACGLPAGGVVYHANTWTLSANCTQTDWILLHTQMNSGASNKIVINGNNKAIKSTNNKGFINCAGSPAGTPSDDKMSLTINNVTIDGGGSSSKGAIWSQNCKVTLNNVTLTNTYASAIMGGSGAGAGNRGEFILNDVLFEDLQGFYSYHGSRPSAINARLSSSWTLNNVVIRDVYGGAFAIGPAWASAADKLLGTAPSFTFTGCYTAERIFVRERHSSVSPVSLPKCTGTIGNQGSAVKTVPHPQPAACGLPSSGFLLQDATYSLSADCALTGTLYIPAGVTITIQGNGRAITPKAGSSVIDNGGNLTIRSAIIQNATTYPLRARYTGALTVEDSVFRNNARPLLIKDPTATFNNVLFENQSVASSWNNGHSLLVMVESDLTLQRSTFRNNQNGGSAIYLAWKSLDGVGPKVKLEGCATFSNNSPSLKHKIRQSGGVDDGTFTDNTSGAACADYQYPAIVDIMPPPATQESAEQYLPTPDATASSKPSRLPIGETGVVFRGSAPVSGGGGAGEQEAVMNIYGVDEQTSQGYHQLTVAQSQVDAMPGPGVVATSADCEAQIWVDEYRNVTVKQGPNYEGKYLHKVFEGSLSGPVISQYTTFNDPICLPVTPTPAGAALRNCMARLNYALNLREVPEGRILRVLPVDVLLTALERRGKWVYVDYHGLRGWISIPHVSLEGDCD